MRRLDGNEGKKSHTLLTLLISSPWRSNWHGICATYVCTYIRAIGDLMIFFFFFSLLLRTSLKVFLLFLTQICWVKTNRTWCFWIRTITKPMCSEHTYICVIEPRWNHIVKVSLHKSHTSTGFFFSFGDEISSWEFPYDYRLLIDFISFECSSFMFFVEASHASIPKDNICVLETINIEILVNGTLIIEL